VDHQRRPADACVPRRAGQPGGAEGVHRQGDKRVDHALAGRLQHGVQFHQNRMTAMKKGWKI